MDWQPEQQDLGVLGFAGVCRETQRVLLRAILPNKKADWSAAILSAVLLSNLAANHAFLSRLDDPDRVPVTYVILEEACLAFIIMLSLIGTADAVYRVAALYCTDGDSGAPDRFLRDVHHATFGRIIPMWLHVYPLAVAYVFFSGLVWHELPRLDASDEVVVLALRLLGGGAFLVGAAYIVVVLHVACVVAVLADAVRFGAVRKSQALLAGKFLVAATVFVPLDCCFVTLQIAFVNLVLEDALGLGRGFQVAAGAAVAVALWAVVVATLVAQPVVYMVCKGHHHEVIDKVHLNYVGEYEPLAVGVEMQPVTPLRVPETAQCASQSAAGSSSCT